MAPISLSDIITALPSEDSWGPPTTSETTLNGVPYAPYSKGDKLGRMADWTAEGKDGRDGRGGRQQYNRNYRVNENAADAPMDASEGSKDAINQPSALAEEATYINHNFANQVMKESESQSKAYKYRKFDLSLNDEDPVHLVCATRKWRCIGLEDEVGQSTWCRCCNRNEEQQLQACKRWTVQSIIAKADVMKLGFVSRANPKLNDRHVILGVIGWKPRDFAQQMNLSLSNGWGIVRTIVDMCLKREEGKYVLVKRS
ncbi:hypothetical protein DID88_006344 [Monilinia fructigena]|uniref:Eukaryotic translation initiation factor 3 subunit D n=1 Tax=Monilinia fructigena TaxID=38457 RepID=A0A395J7J1_9HELO|nr:hypothetical protein DID88_006344 [Monilinia fructigena]